MSKEFETREISRPEGVRLLVLRSALKMELHGMQMTRGMSAYKIIKTEFNLRGSKQKVFDMFSEMLTEAQILIPKV